MLLTQPILAKNNVSVLAEPRGVFLLQTLEEFPKQFYQPYPPPKPVYYGKNLCVNPAYHCVIVQNGDTWRDLFPNKRQRDLVMRLNRTNSALYYRQWILVPNQMKHFNLMDYSPFPDRLPSKGERFILVNLKKYAYAAYNKYGYQIFWGPALGGMKICPDTDTSCQTPPGEYRIFKKGGVSCRSGAFPVGSGGSPMPYCMFFYQGFSIHGAYIPGIPNSHGCVQLFPEDAAWLNENFVNAKYPYGTKVIIED
jgi:hypothetical protein